ncbi:nucleotidyltransferase domain-containing protein [Microbacteriaceae bacterium VKM Ac-2854]|nr:nucleotidyltransferase domain-containing protein [Microbacteriaceae bacterium VKM Ac-2854]
MTLPSTALAEHRDELLDLLRSRGVTTAVVFGSTARGEDIEGSDLDVALRLADPGDGWDYFRIWGELRDDIARTLGVPADVVYLDDPGADRVVTDVLPLLPG